MVDWQSVWTQLADGQHVVLCGAGAIPLPDPARIKLSWVDCEAHPEAGGTMAAARRRIDRDLGINPWIDLCAQRVRSSLRHLLGATTEQIDAACDEHAFRRAAAAPGSPRRALLLSGVDGADEASVERLARLFAGERRPTWPLLIRFDARDPTGAAGRLLEQLERVLPAQSICKGAARAPAAGDGAPAAAHSARALRLPGSARASADALDDRKRLLRHRNARRARTSLGRDPSRQRALARRGAPRRCGSATQR